MYTYCVCLLLCLSTFAQDTDLREPFIRYGPKAQDVSKGDTIRLQCYVYGQPTPKVTWYKDGIPLDDNEAEGRTVEVDKTLVIQKARRNSKHDDSGVYYCYAENEKGYARSNEARINVKYISKPFVETPQNATLRIYADHVMRCKPPVGYPNPTIEWWKDDKPLETDNRVTVTGSTNESEIHFSRITWRSRGKYQCIAVNSEGTRTSKAAFITIEVIPPELYQSSKVVEVYEGKPATLQCPNRFQPEPVRTWSKLYGIMPEASRIQYQPAKKILLITNTKITDSGQYTCSATNDAGQASLKYQLVVYENMRFDVMPTGLTIGKGLTARFDCVVKGGKNSKVLWLYGIYYSKSSVGRIRMDSDNSLIITNVQPTDTNKLQCVGEDGARIFSNEVQLTVLDKDAPLPVIKSLPKIEEVEGSKVVLPCTASGSGKLSFKWLTAEDNKEVIVGAEEVWISSGTHSSNLTLNKALVSDSKVYRCKVYGSSGSSSALTTVKITPSDGDRPPSVPNVKVINIGATEVTLTWSRPSTTSRSPVSSYIIYITDRARSNDWTVAVDDGSATQKKLSKLSPSTIYAISIVAVNKIGEGIKTSFPDVETLANPDQGGPNSLDRLENVKLVLTIGSITSNTIKVSWKGVDVNRVKQYMISYRVAGNRLFVEKRVENTKTDFLLEGLDPNTRYEIQIRAQNERYQSNNSPLVTATTLKKIIFAVHNVQVKKEKHNTATVRWEIPPNIDEEPGISGVIVYVMHSNPPVRFNKKSSIIPIKQTMEVIYNLDPQTKYYVSVAIVTDERVMTKSEEVSFRLNDMNINDVASRILPPADPKSKDEDDGFLAIVKEPWFIATVGVIFWLLLLVIVVLICCRRKKKHNFRGDTAVYESRGLLPIGTGQRSMDYPNTSLNRTRLHEHGHHHDFTTASSRKRKMCGCCGGSKSSSLDEDFPNRADIKPFTAYVRHDNMEMRQKPPGMDSLMKENNHGIAMRNGYKIDTPLNNELGGYRQNSIDNRMYNGADRPRMQQHMGVGGYREQVPPHPGSGSMSRRNDARIKQDSVDRRLGEIRRTNKTPEDDVNVMSANSQASWKREQKPKDPPNFNQKPPGENTLRRQGKTQFKPLPNLEVLKWADNLPDSSKAPSTNDGSPPGSPKTATSASVMSEADHPRADSRLESHGGSSNSLNKYPYDKRRRRNSNASSMMSSELYQSEMDPSGYSDVVTDRKKRKEKSIPPPIDFDGLTSDILLQWAESVTNSSPSSSGSSSPSRLSGISSEGSLYTDEDFAQAVAAVAECGGFNMDYDYNLPGMNLTQAPLSSTRNSKMDKIDQVFAQRSKPRNSPAVAGSKPGSRPDTSTPQSYVPQISMSSYLTGSQKGPQSTHSSSTGASRPSRHRGGEKSDKNNPRYGTGFDDVDSAKPLTISNLLKHDSSLDREKKESAKPLTVSNLRQHETSLDRDRDRRQKPITYDKPPPYESIEQNGYRDGTATSKSNPLLPEAALSVTSALERHESMNSKDSLNSSNRHDSEIENNAGTSERRQQRRSKKHQFRDPQSSTSTVNTVHTSPENESNC